RRGTGTPPRAPTTRAGYPCAPAWCRCVRGRGGTAPAATPWPRTATRRPAGPRPCRRATPTPRRTRVVGVAERGDRRRRLAGIAGEVVEPGERGLVRAPCHVVVVGGVLDGTEGVHGDVHDVGSQGAHALVVEPEVLERRAAVVGEEHVA